MPTAQYQVSASNQDADEDADGSDFSSTAVLFTINNTTIAGSRGCAGFWFGGVMVPQGRRVLSATLEIRFGNGTDDPDNCTIRGNDVDNAANFTDEPDVVSRVLTTASVAWPGTNIGNNAFKTTPDISTIIQEIVDRSGWVAGNAIELGVFGRTAGTTSFTALTWDEDPAFGAKLNITWQGGGSGGGGQGGGNGGGSNGSGGNSGGGKPSTPPGKPAGQFDKKLVGSRKRNRQGVV